MPIVQSQYERFTKQLQYLLEREGFRDGLQKIVNWELESDRIQGRFAGVVNNKLELFNFTISNEGIEYKLSDSSNRSDAYLEGLFFVNPVLKLDNNREYITSVVLARSDKKDRKACTTGIRCGKTCIERSKQCAIRSAETVRFAREAIATAKQIDLAKPSNSGSSGNRQKSIPTSAKATKILLEEEDAIRFNNFETVVIVDPETGKVPTRKKGQRTRVDFTRQEVEAFKGKILTHNHPWIEVEALDAKGSSFSLEDLNASCVAQVAEVRACTSHYRHSMKPPKEGWNEAFFHEKVAPIYSVVRQEEMMRLVDEVRQSPNPVEASRYADQHLHHRTWERVAKQTGMQYVREEIPNVDTASVVKQRKRYIRNKAIASSMKQLAVLGLLAAAGAAAIQEENRAIAERSMPPPKKPPKRW